MISLQLLHAGVLQYVGGRVQVYHTEKPLKGSTVLADHPHTHPYVAPQVVLETSQLDVEL